MVHAPSSIVITTGILQEFYYPHDVFDCVLPHLLMHASSFTTATTTITLIITTTVSFTVTIILIVTAFAYKLRECDELGSDFCFCM